jgi:von Willebrand factor type A domain
MNSSTNSRSSVRVFAVLSSGLLAALIACSSHGSELVEDDFPPIDNSSGASGTTTSGIIGFGSSSGDGGTSGASGTSGAICAAVSAKSELQRVNLVFVLDRSGSMGGENRSKRWTPVTKAIKDFTTAPSSKGIDASLTFFPSPNDKCTADSYDSPAVSIVSLPSNAFGSKIDMTEPNVNDTPIRFALQGAAKQVAALRAQRPADKSVIVLATDGGPAGCSEADRKVDNIADDVKKSGIDTHVIGIGNVTVLNKIAAAGKTGQAIIVDINDPAQTTTQLVAALNKIRKDSISCSIVLPAPPDGRKLDVNKVSVKFDGKAITYNAQCAGDEGWRFDNPADPKQIQLCKAACDSIKGQPGKLDVSFECTNQQQAVN